MQIPWSTLVIAKHLGKVLTPETAKSLALEIENGPPAPALQEPSKHNDYNIETAEYLAHGLRLFQAVLADTTEVGHARILHSVIGAPAGATYVDMGCGVGEISRLFAALDPAAQFYSVTNSETQAALTRHYGGSQVVLADFHTTGLPDGLADVVMFNETWGYGEPARLAAEAYRLLKPGGQLFLKDWYAKSNGYSTDWDWHQWDMAGMQEPLLQAGFCVVCVQPMVNPQRERYEQFMNASALMRRMHPRVLQIESTPAYFIGVKPC